MPVLKNDVIKSLTFLRLPERHQAALDEPERHQAALDELHLSMQRLPRAIIDMNAFESEFLEYQATTDDQFPTYFDYDDKPM